VNLSIGQPLRVATDSSGNVYFSSGNSVFELSTKGLLTIVAGNSRPGFSGDGGLAINAQLRAPKGLAVDSAGNLYIADSGNNRVREVSSSGIITTIAGLGVPADGGDSGLATAGLLHLPSGVAIDKTGNLYIADSGNARVRIVTPDGTITTFAGVGEAGFSGDGGIPSQAALNNPEDVAVDSSGNVYIADTGNNNVRKVAASVITTVAGNSVAGYAGDGGIATKAALSEPVALTVDSSGNIYIAEYGNSRIRQVSTKGIITTIAGNGTLGYAGDGSQATKAELSSAGVAIDSSGNLYVADRANFRIRQITSSGNITTVAGNGIYSDSGDGGAAINAQLNGPKGVAVDAAGNLYIADAGNNSVREVSRSGVITTIAGGSAAGSAGDGGPAAKAQLNGPRGLALDSSGNLYIADTGNNRVREITTDGNISTVAGNGTAGYSGDGGPPASGELSQPYGVAVDTGGNLYIADSGNSRVRKVSGGILTTVAGNGATDYSGDGGQATSAALNGPLGIAVDSAHNLYIADTANNRIRFVASNGMISTVAGTGAPGYSGDNGPAMSAELAAPVAVAVDAAGDIYIADSSTRIRKVYPDGFINNIAGSGVAGYSGDAGIATSGQLNGPSAIALDSAGNLYVADTGNNAVRLLQPAASGIAIGAVTNAASNLSGSVAPGEIVVIYGSGLGPDQLTTFQINSQGLIDTTAGGTRVIFNGTAAPILYASATQVAAIVPYEVSGPNVQVVVHYSNQVAAPVTLPLALAAPGLFTYNSSGIGQAAAPNLNGGLNTPDNPAPIGSFLSLFATGEGQTSPAGVDGLLDPAPAPQPALQVTVTLGGKTVVPQYAGGSPGSVAGLMQINVQIPSGITPGSSVPVFVTIGGIASQSGVTVAVSAN
jgi:uncharacterized protein (TIGR03437 family)